MWRSTALCALAALAACAPELAGGAGGDDEEDAASAPRPTDGGDGGDAASPAPPPAGDLASPAAPPAADLTMPAPATADLASGCPRGTLDRGDRYVIAVDGYTGDEATTQPKTDKNDGQDGDNPYFQRNNVARAHNGGTGPYWYTSSHREAGEPDPGGPQWVDYRPPLMSLGAGRYRLTIHYRQSDNRASYPARYVVTHAAGETVVTRDQRLGSGIAAFPLGEFDLGCTGWVRARDTGSASISFAHLELTYLGR